MNIYINKQIAFVYVTLSIHGLSFGRASAEDCGLDIACQKHNFPQKVQPWWVELYY